MLPGLTKARATIQFPAEGNTLISRQLHFLCAVPLDKDCFAIKTRNLILQLKYYDIPMSTIQRFLSDTCQVTDSFKSFSVVTPSSLEFLPSTLHHDKNQDPIYLQDHLRDASTGLEFFVDPATFIDHFSLVTKKGSVLLTDNLTSSLTSMEITPSKIFTKLSEDLL